MSNHISGETTICGKRRCQRFCRTTSFDSSLACLLQRARTLAALAVAVVGIIALGLAMASAVAAEVPTATLLLSCTETNDLYRVLLNNGIAARRFDTPEAAVDAAPDHAGVLILASEYPIHPTRVSEAAFARAKSKQLRLYLEFPERVPCLDLGKVEGNKYERAVVSGDLFAPDLPRLRVLGINGLRYVSVSVTNAELVAARVAGFDSAVYGLPESTRPLLFRHPDTNLLVATTALSRFVTGRYGPAEAWRVVWRRVLTWTAPQLPLPELKWVPMVAPSYGRDEPLPPDAERQALRRAVDWFGKSKLLLHPSRLKEVDQAAQGDGLLPTPPPDAPNGDGSLGILEAPLSIIQSDGSQTQSVARRGDCTAESAMALAFGGRVFDEQDTSTIARRLLDYYYFASTARQGERADPKHGAFGLVAWGISSPAWYVANYGDDNARLLLGTLASAALLGEDRWDEPMMRCLLANLRTTGRLGFRGDRIDLGPLGERGWRHFYERDVVNLAPHFEAYLWACYLWAYQRTGDEAFLTRTLNAIRATVEAFPKGIRWTNGLAQERARLLLPLAWLVKIQDTPEHREWLRQAVEGLLALQDDSGGIREELGPPGQGMMPPPRSNEEYGLNEASLIQQNGDPVADMLYTVNFAFLGLHEAAAAVRDPRWLAAEDKLARFLVRIQIRSTARPELDGGWFRAFDMRRWEAWGSNADAGWGAWAIESGWTQGWIGSVLALRQLRTTLWDLTAGSQIAKHHPELRRQMLPAETVSKASSAPDATTSESPADRWPAKSLKDKTLVAWVSPADTTQRGGSVLTLMKAEDFDAVVFGERVPGRWMAGSEFFRRTQSEDEQKSNLQETADPQTLVQLAVTYANDHVTLYRNAQLYRSYRVPQARPFGTNTTVLLGLRYLGEMGEIGFFSGAIEDARIYDLALDLAQIAALVPKQASNPKPLAWWTFQNGKAEDLMRTFPATRLEGNAHVADGRLILDGSSYLQAARDAKQLTADVEEETSFDATPQALFYKARSRRTGNMWDTWLFWHEGTNYLYYLARSRGQWDNISMATSPDGAHWQELGRVLSKGRGVTWMGTGSTWRSPTFERDATFIMNFSEWKGPRQTIFFAQSKDLLHWTRLGNEYEFVQDERWYEPNGRWDCIWTLPRPGGGLYGYWTATPKPETRGKFGFGETLDGINWKALSPPEVSGVGEGEVGAIEKLGDKYYLMFGTGGQMVTLLADQPAGPFRPASKNFHLLAGHTYFSRFYRTPEGVLVNHHSIARDGQVYFGTLKATRIDPDGALRLAWWPGNEALKRRPAEPMVLPSARPGGSSVTMLDRMLDTSTGVILEGTLKLPPSTNAPPVGLFLQLRDELGAAILVLPGGLTEFGPMRPDGSGFQGEHRADREWKFGPTARFRLLLRGTLLEFYLDDLLMQCYSLTQPATGRIGLISAGNADAFAELQTCTVKLR